MDGGTNELELGKVHPTVWNPFPSYCAFLESPDALRQFSGSIIHTVS